MATNLWCYFPLRMRDYPWHISIRLANIYSILSSINIYPLLNTVLKNPTKSLDDFLRDIAMVKSRDLIFTKISCLCCNPNYIISYWIESQYTWCLMVLIISLIMARISTENRGRVIGLLQAGVSQGEVARCLHCHQSYVARLWE